jgi:hypothetical protein
MKRLWNLFVYVITFQWLAAGWKKLFNKKEKEPENLSRVQRREQPLYDTVTVRDGTSQLNFFQVPLGATMAKESAPKTQVETDMDQGGSLPYPKTFYIEGITVTPGPTVPYSLSMKLLDNSWLRLFIGTKDYLVAPTNQVAYVANKSDYKYPGPIFKFANPIKLLPQQNMRVEINFPRPVQFPGTVATREAKLQVTLHGYYEFKTHYVQQEDGQWVERYGSVDENYPSAFTSVGWIPA